VIGVIRVRGIRVICIIGVIQVWGIRVICIIGFIEDMVYNGYD